MTHGLLQDDEDDPGLRLSADDQATRQDARFLAAALASQRRVGAQRQANPGVCANCNEACLPLAIYCDDDCRADHEHRQDVLKKTGGAR